MIATLGIGLLGVLAMQATTPPDIAGSWQGEDWGQVTLAQTAPGQYTGTYTDTVAKEKGPGKIELKWSRIEHRFNGTWREGEDDRFGDLSIRLMGKEIHGGLTTSAKSKINPATPRLGDLMWIRSKAFDRHVSLAVTRKESFRVFTGILPQRLGEAIAKADGVAEVSSGLMEITPIEELGDEPVAIQGFQPGDFKLKEYKTAAGGECLSQRSRGKKQLMIGRSLAEVKRLKVGGKLTLYDEKYTIIGVFDSSSDVDNAMGVMLMEDLQRITGQKGRITGCLVRLDKAHDNSEGAKAVKELIEGKIAEECGLKDMIRATPITEVGSKTGTIPGTNAPHPHALHFDQSHYAVVPPSTKFTAGDFTISLWLKPESKGRRTTAIGQHVVFRGYGYRDQRGDIGLSINRLSGDLDFVAYGENDNGAEWIFGWDVPEPRLRSPIRYDRWNHVAVTRSGDKYTMWVNGARACTERSSADISDAHNTNPFNMGAGAGNGPSGVGSLFGGDTDDFRIFRRCLSEKEIVADLYKSNGDEAFLQDEGRAKVGPLRAVDAPSSDKLERFLPPAANQTYTFTTKATFPWTSAPAPRAASGESRSALPGDLR
jgi:hypothetical protein